MKERRSSSLFRFLAGYYGFLQSFHLILLVRAGWFLINGRGIPFPAPPPTGGWPAASLPYLLGMGIVDLFAIGLGLIYVYYFFFKDQVLMPLGLISLTAALSSGIVYLVGTIPSGAWEANLPAYAAVLVLFSPVLFLYYCLIRNIC